MDKSSEQNRIPFFSVIIATYNRSDLVPRALDSLLSQTEKDWEALVVDDGSTEDIYARILPYLGKSSKIQFIPRAHQGMARTKNAGIFASRGRYITFLDSDDEYDSLHLETRRAILEQNRIVQLLHGGARIIGNEYVPDRFNPGSKIHLNDCAIGGTFFIERSSALLLKGFGDFELEADSDLLDRATSAGLCIMKVDIPTYIYHHDTENSMTNSLLADL